MMRLVGLLTLIGIATLASHVHAQAIIEVGNGEKSVMLSPSVTLKVFTYRPAACLPRRLLVVFHGVGRDAGPYRDRTRPLADAICAIAVVPEFDSDRFPSTEYQRGGSTTQLVPPLVAWARTAAAQPGIPFVLIGHSAGAQFLSCVAAYGQATGAARVVIANPSTWVLPSTSVASPYGFGGMANGEQAMRAYLALPIVVLLGGDDTGTRNLSTSKEATAQGANRLERGRYTFRQAQTTAQKQGWPLGWTLVEIPGVGHDAARMFSAPQTVTAIGP